MATLHPKCGMVHEVGRPCPPADEQPFGSHTWEWRKVKISRAPQATSTAGRKAVRWRKLPSRNPREPLSITVSLRGGPEAWVEVHARGSVGRYPGHTCIYDVLADINNLKRT